MPIDLRTMLKRLWRFVWPGDGGDGFGQTMGQDLRYTRRARALRRREIAWRAPDAAEAAAIDAHPLLGRFGDTTVAVARIDGRAASLRERIWFGWPDPPEWALFVLDEDGEVWAAGDFDGWPRRWRFADQPAGEPPRWAGTDANQRGLTP